MKLVGEKTQLSLTYAADAQRVLDFYRENKDYLKLTASGGIISSLLKSILNQCNQQGKP